MINLRLKLNIHWEEKWETTLGKDDIEWDQIWQNLHKNKINYYVQSTIWQQNTKTYITGYDLTIWGLLEESLCKRFRTRIATPFNGMPDSTVYTVEPLKTDTPRDRP